MIDKIKRLLRNLNEDVEIKMDRLEWSARNSRQRKHPTKPKPKIFNANK